MLPSSPTYRMSKGKWGISILQPPETAYASNFQWRNSCICQKHVIADFSIIESYKWTSKITVKFSSMTIKLIPLHQIWGNTKKVSVLKFLKERGGGGVWGGLLQKLTLYMTHSMTGPMGSMITRHWKWFPHYGNIRWWSPYLLKFYGRKVK